MDDVVLTNLRAAGAMIGESNLPSWEEILAKAGSDSELRFAIARTKREIGHGQVTATQVAKTMRHTLKCHEPERKKGEPLAERRPSAPIPKSATSTPVTPTVEESAPIAAEVVQDAEHEPTLAPIPQPATERKSAATSEESIVPKPAAIDFRELAKQLGTFRVADLAKKARCSQSTGRQAVEEMEADGFVVRETPGNRKSPYVLAGARAEKPAAAAGGGVKPAPARRSPQPRPEAASPSPLPFDLDGRFAELLGRLVDAYAEKHDLGPKPSARRALLEAAAAVFPSEG